MKTKKYLITLLIIFHQLPFLFAQINYRDSIDVLSYIIHLDVTKPDSKTIIGQTDIKFVPNFDASIFKLDFEGLETDSIMFENQKLKFKHQGSILSIYTPRKYSLPDTLCFKIYYHGSPIHDKKWGGFFISNDYAFNYGIGMDAIPPNYGRVWFPCIDSFTDRAYYEYFIKTKGNHIAACPGLPISDETMNDGTKIYHWKLKQSIPTYLSSVAVGEYSIIKDTVAGIERNIPIELFIDKNQANAAIVTFKNVNEFFHAFEYRFGPYKWDKVGYVSTRFRGGAMEHATNIAYSSYCNGTSACESTLVHELSHHWFGDLVTCRSEKDMWLNEGWARYAEAIYYEYAGGLQAYKKQIRENHHNVLFDAVKNPSEYGSIYGMPHSETYGSVVYDKGGDVAHTLRGQLGDSLFFSVLKQYFIDYAFKDISVVQFKSYLINQTKMDLTDFFDFWVFSSGFPHFSIENLKVNRLKNKYQVDFKIHQQLLNAKNYLTKSQIEVGILDKNLKLNIYKLGYYIKTENYKLILDYEPKLLIIDPEEKISDATTDEYVLIEKPFEYNFISEYFSLNVKSLSSPLFIDIAYNWVPPSNNNFEAKTLDKYWEIKLYSNTQMDAGAKFYFEFDADLIKQLGTTILSNLCLVYRENEFSEWKKLDSKIETRSRNSYFDLIEIKPGQYTISIR